MNYFPSWQVVAYQDIDVFPTEFVASALGRRASRQRPIADRLRTPSLAHTRPVIVPPAAAKRPLGGVGRQSSPSPLQHSVELIVTGERRPVDTADRLPEAE